MDAADIEARYRQTRQGLKTIWKEFDLALWKAYGRYVASGLGTNKQLVVPVQYKHMYKECLKRVLSFRDTRPITLESVLDLCCWAARYGVCSAHAVNTILEMNGLNEPSRQCSELQFMAASVGALPPPGVADGRLGWLVSYFGWYAENVHDESQDVLSDQYNLDSDEVVKSLPQRIRDQIVCSKEGISDLFEWANTPFERSRG